MNQLPERWFVKATRENELVLKEWRGGNYISWNDNLVMSSNLNGQFRYWDNINYAKDNGFTEITFDQFKQFVLKQEPNYIINLNFISL